MTIEDKQIEQGWLFRGKGTGKIHSQGGGGAEYSYSVLRRKK